MFGIGVPELILILIVGLIVFGPSKLPEVGRAVGKGLREFKKASNAITQAINAPDEPAPRSAAHPASPTPEAKAAPREPAAASETAPQPKKAEGEQASAKKKAPTAEETAAGMAAAGTVEAAAPKSSIAAGYEPPTQDSVRAAIAAQKGEAAKDEAPSENKA